MQRLCVSLVGMPLALMIVTTVLSCGIGVRSCGPSEWIASSLAAPGFVFLLFLVFPLVLLLSAAAFLFLFYRRLFAWWHFVAAGAIAGAVGGLLSYLPTLSDNTLRGSFRLAAVAQVYVPSVACAAVFGVLWLAAVWRNRALVATTPRHSTKKSSL